MTRKRPAPPEVLQPERDRRADTDSLRQVSGAIHDEILADMEAEAGGSLDSDFDLGSLKDALAAIDVSSDGSSDGSLGDDSLGMGEPAPDGATPGDAAGAAITGADAAGAETSAEAAAGAAAGTGGDAPGAVPATGTDRTGLDIAWAQFRRNRMAWAALWFLGLILALAVGAPLLASDRPFLWIDEGERSWPWFASLFDRNLYESPVDVFFNLLLAAGVPLLLLWLVSIRALPGRGQPRRLRQRRLRREALALSGLLLAGFAALSAFPASSEYVLYPRLLREAEAEGRHMEAVFPPTTLTPRMTGFPSAAPPSRDHVLGTDQSTRDVAVRILYGIRISLTIGVIAVAIYVLIGVLVGAIAGYFGGWIDLVIQRVVEVVMSVPGFFLILTVMAFIEQRSIFHVMVVLGLIRWTTVARLVRGEFLRLRNMEYVTAAVALGYPPHRIIFQHILPGALGPVFVTATFGVAACILVEASLSFLGLGDLSAPSWGQMIQEGYNTGAWHLILVPGAAIFLTVSALNLVGEGLRDALDPRLRQ